MYTNTDIFTTMKKSELLKLVDHKKPHMTAIFEVKPKSQNERTKLDYLIPGCNLLVASIKTWNKLSKEILHALFIDSFKNKLNDAWKYLSIIFYEQEQFIKDIDLPANL